ncbi:intracellular septation protein [Rhizobium sp. BK196]|jgi:intracellular septation protein|uniref:Inner membrane-spanning protein YciB n=1 Tax=Rhizobium mesosinicum TaxID=335017 RepID=A0ABS7GW98_9HYPH|nr:MULTISPECIES: septation protein A [Rhizobium]MBB3313507.1 intracellular septation protein [Rhizobium sp. BK196]MBB3463593.1 intracellular septation protein [Rhizobium sp. BK377]MBW9054224.1 septation protein A [Rhizobium mesosinicum]
MTTESDITPSAADRHHPLLKLALELGPLLVFFFANLRGEWLVARFPALAELGGPLFVATGLFMGATILSLVVSKIMLGHLPIMPFVSGIVVLIFGSLSIWLQNETFIKMKPTIVNALFGFTLLGGLAFGKSLLGYVFNAAFQLDAEGWRKLTIRWGIFFLFLAVLNEVVWRNFSDNFWIAFKVWGTMPITIIFTMAQMPLVLKHSISTEAESEK